MPATIRLKRVGRKKQPSYRIVVIEKSASVDGLPIENLGIYQPRTEPSVIRLDAEKALRWLRDGAEPSDTVRSLLRRAGLWEKFHDGVTPEELTEKEIYLGPEGAWKTSGRAAAAAAAREAAAEAAEAEAEAAEAEAAEAEASADVEPAADEEVEEDEEAEAPAAEVTEAEPEASEDVDVEETGEADEPEADEEASADVEPEASADVEEDEEADDEDEEDEEEA